MELTTFSKMVNNINFFGIERNKIEEDSSSIIVHEKPFILSSTLPCIYLPEEILKFISIMHDNNIDMTLLNHNIMGLKISRMSISSFINFNVCNTIAEYDVEKNCLYIGKKHPYDLFHHECNHVASSILQNNVVFSAFSQVSFDNNTSIGDGICEGYTDVLTSRQLGDVEVFCEEISNSTLFIESLIGKERMTELYYSADLLGLIEELKRYDCEENIMSYIADLDELYDKVSKEKIVTTKRFSDEIDALLDRIESFESKIKANCNLSLTLKK